MKHYPRIILFPVTTISVSGDVESSRCRELSNKNPQTQRIKRTTKAMSCLFFAVVVHFRLIFVRISLTYVVLRLVCLDPGEQAFYALKCPTLCRYRISNNIMPPIIFGGGGGAA